MKSRNEQPLSLDDDPANEALKRAFRQRPLAQDEPELPAAAELWDAVRGDLDPQQVRALVERTADSPELAEEWRLAQAVDEEARQHQAAAPAGHPAFARRRPVVWPLALAALLVVAFSAWLLAGWQADRNLGSVGDPILRDGDTAILSSLLAPGTELPRAAPVLIWQGPGGARFDIRVSDTNLELLAEARDLDEPRFELPSEVLADLPPGSEILWQVEATLISGERVVSETFVHRLR